MNACLHWDHCDCEACMAECDAVLHPLDGESCIPAEIVTPALASAIEEAINSQALPGSIHHRLEAAWQAVVGQGRP